MLTVNRKIGIPAYKGHSLRLQALHNLSTSPLLDTNFIIRNKNQAFELEFKSSTNEADAARVFTKYDRK